MRAKLILLALVMLAILFVSAQEGGVSYTIIRNCEDAGYNQCDYVVSPIYKFDAIQTGGAKIIFPENPVPKESIGCTDETAVFLGRYDGTKWVPISGDIRNTAAGIQIEAWIDQLGELAIVQKTIQTGFTPEQSCTPIGCGDNGAFITEPFNIYMTPEGKSLPSIKENTPTKFKFCGMLPGCRVNQWDGSCDQYERHCQKGIAINCPQAYCNPATDGACDTDCYTETDENGHIILAVDPDCTGELIDAEAGLELAAPNGELAASSESGVWESYELGGAKWGLPAMLYGMVQFSTGKGFGATGSNPDSLLQFRDFQYQDYFTDEWHLLTPAAPRPNGHAVGSYGRFDGYLASLWIDPTMWYQANSDGTTNQFYFFDTPVKKIKFLVKRPGDGSPSSFRVGFSTLGDESTIDPDRDGVASTQDCDDSNPNIHPGAKELCDGIDNDCDIFNTTDESVSSYYGEAVFGEDKDHDGEGSFMMPCDGYIQFTKVVPLAYMEVKRVDAFHPADIESYTIPGWFGFNPAVFNNDNQAIADYFGYGPISELPQEYRSRNKVILYAGRCTYGGDGCLTTNPMYSSKGGGCPVADCSCIPGMEDSCTCEHGTEEPTCPTRDGRKNPLGESNSAILCERNAAEWFDPLCYMIQEETEEGVAVPSANLERQIKLLRGDILKIFTDEDGVIKLDMYCYGKKPNWNNIDEGCERKKVRIYVCTQDAFSQQERKCMGPTLCPPIEVLEASISTASINPADYVAADCTITSTSEMLGQHSFYTYICPEDASKPCYKFFDGKYQVCSNKELCYGGIDEDCDGLVDREDLDCAGVCYEGECDIQNRKWCTSSEWKTEDYCVHCGQQDSTCQKSCAPGDQSCDGGCREGACDTAANLVCTNGAWTTSSYLSKCRAKDAEYNGNCEEGSCDTQHNSTCLGERWITDANCMRSCGPKDASCYTDRKETYNAEPYCEPSTCDIYENKYCTAQHEWTGQDYCRYCGAIDSTCGSKTCTNNIATPSGDKKNCDYISQRYCKNGQWLSAGYCSIDNCGLDLQSRGICGCTSTADKETGSLCLNHIDDDCDGYTDCADADCPADMPGCTCEENAEKTCFADPLNHLGLCAEQSGMQTCANNIWESCIGAFTPETESCNNFDDDCDGDTDEGCGNCQTGQTRNCGEDRGACGSGVQECDEKGYWSGCFGTGYKRPELETCGDGVDNDCNGEVDEGCGCKEGEEQQCGTDVGECEFGTQKCIDGVWGACLGGKDKMSEVGSQCMDGKDNDCDGKTDGKDENCGVTPEAELAPTCYDTTQNGDEEEIDCGGSCPPCDQVSCSDRQQNGDEEGRDCGGTRGCPSCRGKKVTQVEAAENKEGAEEVTEELPAKNEGGFPWIYIIGGTIVIGAVLFLLYNKFGKKPTPKEERKVGIIAAGQTSARPEVRAQPKPVRERITKTKEESFLEKSFEESKKLFKK